MQQIVLKFTYICKQFFKTYFDVIILEKPNVTVPGKITESATTVIIDCTASGSPAVTAVYWSLDGTNLIIANSAKYSGGIVSNPSLTINNIESTDAGEYHCGATNLLGSTTSTQSVTLGNIICILLYGGNFSHFILLKKYNAVIYTCTCIYHKHDKIGIFLQLIFCFVAIN